jgi:hypothetical protein
VLELRKISYDISKMNLPRYIRIKMSLRERIKFWYIRKRIIRLTKKMDYHISKSKKYEEYMYKGDDRFVEYTNEMCMKYA